jgi:hypothetical protein
MLALAQQGPLPADLGGLRAVDGAKGGVDPDLRETSRIQQFSDFLCPRSG